MRIPTKILTAAFAALLAAAIVWIGPAITQAQEDEDETALWVEFEALFEDLTAALLERVDRLETDVDQLDERVDRLESIREGPGPAIDRENDAHCVIAFSGQMGGRPFLQHETILRYLDQYGEMPASYVLLTVKVDRETGETLLVYATQTGGRWTVERWQGCRFEGSDAWREAAG